MAAIIRKTEALFPGPWLLGDAAIKDLDEILDEQLPRIVAHGKRADPPSLGLITLTLASGNKVRVERLREAKSDVYCEQDAIVKMEMRLRYGDIVGDLVVPSSDKNEALSIVTLPEASEPAVELFVRLNGWATQYQPDWLRRLFGMGPVGALVLTPVLLAVIMMLGLMTGMIKEESAWHSEVDTLLARGIRTEDQNRALELLLQDAAGIPEKKRTVMLPKWYRLVAAVVVLWGALLCFPSRTAFAIGKGRGSVTRQERYDYFLRKIVPTLLVTGVLASIIGTLLLEWLR